jgi:putative glutathione S-transferase
LEQAVGVTVADPIRDERGWAFRDGPGFNRDPVNGFQFLSEAYSATDAKYSGRVSVPVLRDKETRQIVNNSEDADDINPTRIVPLGPVLDLQRPHGSGNLR